MYINFDLDSIKKPKIAIYGGSFNPIHIGHIQLAEYFIDFLKPYKFIMIPDRIPPHKSDKEMASAEHRMNMCKLSLRETESAEVSDIELKRTGKSYTIYTLRELNEMYPDAQLFLIMGADMFLILDKWKDYKEIFERAIICAVPRDESSVEELIEYSKSPTMEGIRCIISDSMMMNVSSTQIRSNVKNGKSITGMVNTATENYIYKNNIYKS